MITYNKRKNSDNWYMPYLNVAIVTLIISVFVAMNVKVSESPYTEQGIASEASVTPVDVSGEWVGTMTEDYGAEIRYDYRIIFDQYQGELEGFTFQETTNYSVEIYAESDITGSVTGDDIYFYEEATLNLDNLTIDHWCRIAVNLSYQVIEGQETLIGTWEGAENRAGCDTIEGRVVLTRETN